MSITVEDVLSRTGCSQFETQPQARALPTASKRARMAVRVDAGITHVIATRAALRFLSDPVETESIDIEMPTRLYDELNHLHPTLETQEVVSAIVEEFEARFTERTIWDLSRRFLSQGWLVPELDVLPVSLTVSRRASAVIERFARTNTIAGVFLALALRRLRRSVEREIGSPREARRLRVRGAAPALRRPWAADETALTTRDEAAWYATLLSSLPADRRCSRRRAPAMVGEFVAEILARMPGEDFGFLNSLKRQVLVAPKTIISRAEANFESAACPFEPLEYVKVDIPIDERMDAVAELLAIPAVFARGAAIEELILEYRRVLNARVEAPS